MNAWLRLRTFVVAAVLLVGACATPGDVRMKAPAFEGSSSKDAKSVAGCIADRWESGGHQPNINARPTASGYSLTAASDLGIYGKDTSFVIDVQDTPTGSTTRFYSNIALSSGTNLVTGIARECQK
jgi:hypothetical protein